MILDTWALGTLEEVDYRRKPKEREEEEEVSRLPDYARGTPARL